MAKQIFSLLKSFLVLFLWLGSLVPPLQGQAFDCNGDFYLVLSNSGGESQLYRVTINPMTQAVVFDPVSANGAGANLNAIGYRQSDNYIYAINPSTYELNQIGADGRATSLGTLLDLIGNTNYGYFAADITPDGQYMVLLGAGDDSSGEYGSREIVYIDLEDPDYGISRKELIVNRNFFCTDIAFDPLQNILYGFDLIANRLITIDPETGIVDDQSFPISDKADAMGAIFFDAFGRLYGYGNNLGENQSRRLFQVNTSNGVVTPLTEGPVASGKDGCACPYTVRLEKTVSLRQAFPCTEVLYSFQVANASGLPQQGIELYDQIPNDFTITEIVRNPFGGILSSGVGSNILRIEDMEIPPGVDSVTVRVAIGPAALGTYANQATLSGLPQSLGEETISDDPSTLAILDSTLLEVIPLFVDLKNDTLPLCGDEALVLDATTYGATYQWSDGSSDPILSADQAGWYWVEVSTPCKTVSDSVFIYEVEVAVSLGEDMEITQGDSVRLIPEIIPPTGMTYQWTDPLGNSLHCTICEIPTARPLEDVIYTLTADNGQGCVDSDDIAIRVIKVRGVFAPNVFSPDGDGANDFFYLQGPRDFEMPVLRIFNRWGALLYEQFNGRLNEEQSGWDGRFKEAPLNPDVFVWYAQVKYPDGEIEILSGDVLLMR